MERYPGGPLTQAQLAKACDVSQQAIGAIVTGKNKGRELLDKIAKHLGVNWGWLVFGDPEVAPKGYKEDEAGRARLKRETAAEIAAASASLETFSYEDLEKASKKALFLRLQKLERQVQQLSEVILGGGQASSAQSAGDTADRRNRAGRDADLEDAAEDRESRRRGDEDSDSGTG